MVDKTDSCCGGGCSCWFVKAANYASACTKLTRSQLSRVAYALPTRFTSAAELVDIYTEFIRPLPVPVFEFFVRPRPPALHHAPGIHERHHFEPAFLTYLHRNLLRLLLASSSFPKDSLPLTPQRLAAHYLPFAANSTSATDNARASLVLEVMLRTLTREISHEPDAHNDVRMLLRKAMEVGTEARKAKATRGKSKRGGKKDHGTEVAGRSHVTDMQWLEMSEQRMALVLATTCKKCEGFCFRRRSIAYGEPPGHEPTG